MPGHRRRATAVTGAIFGDVDCAANVDSVDALKDLIFVAQLPPLNQHQPCPDIGTRAQLS